MKGIVFKEFIDLVEDKFGPDVADKIIESNELSSGGAYTSVGTYDHEEILKLVVSLSAEVNIPVPDLVKVFGRHLVTIFKTKFPDFFKTDSCFDFLKSIEDHIHVEVKKLYPKAELPTFKYSEPSATELHLEYQSTRPFADLAQGLIEESIAHFGEAIEVETEDPEGSNGCQRNFKLSRVS